MEHIDDIPRVHTMHREGWIGQDAWFRRVVGDGTYLMVSRRRLDPPYNDRRMRAGAWTYGWRWTRWYLNGIDGIAAQGPNYQDVGWSCPTPNIPVTYDTALEAITAADKHATEIWKT